MLGHDLEMACAKLQENPYKIDGEIEEKHALQIYQNNCVLDYSYYVECELKCLLLKVMISAYNIYT